MMDNETDEQWMDRALSTIYGAGLNTRRPLPDAEALYERGNTCLTMIAGGRGLTARQRETLMMAFGGGYANAFDSWPQ